MRVEQEQDHSPGEGGAKVDAHNKAVADGRGLLGGLAYRAVDGLGGRGGGALVALEVVPAVAVALAGRRVQRQRDAHCGWR